MRFDTGCACCADPGAAYEDWLLSRVAPLTHPLARQAMARLRDPASSAQDFAQAAAALGAMLIVEATRDISFASRGFEPMADETFDAPPALEKLLIVRLDAAAERLLAFAPALRSVEVAALEAEADLADSPVLMLGATLPASRAAMLAADLAKDHGARHLRLACLVASSAGIEALRCAHPDVTIHTVAIEDEVDRDGAVAHGFGAAGEAWLRATGEV